MRRGSCRRRPAGTGILSDPSVGRAIEVEFFQCCHCGRHHPVRASIDALIRKTAEFGYCAACDGVHCPGCTTCVPIERQLENVEAGRDPLDTSRLTLAFPHSPAADPPRILLGE